MASNGSEGAILIKGANGSLGLSFVEHLLQHYPSYFAILAVRDTSESDRNTAKLRQIVSKFSSARVSIEALDLASLSNVRSFADNVAARVSAGTIPPISATVCNAFTWSLIDIKYSKDGYELGFQVTHLSHFVLVMKLLSSMNKETGRIILLGSDSHDPRTEKVLNPLGAEIPKDLEDIIKPKGDTDSVLRNITVTAMDPGGMPTSRCFDQAPLGTRMIMNILGHVVLPVAQYLTDALNTTKASGRNLVMMSVCEDHIGERGYYLGQKSSTSSVESQDEESQKKMWVACARWAKVQPSESVLNVL